MQSQEINLIYSIESYHMWIIRTSNPTRDKLQCFFLDCSHTFDEGLFGDVFTITADGTADILTHHFVHIQHI